jgi:DNA-binding transcriptional ArsR family regulator
VRVLNQSLERALFSSVFERDIRRLYFYKKAERLARAIAMVSPAFTDLARERLEDASLGVVEGTIVFPRIDFQFVARHLLLITNILSGASARGQLSTMNAELISNEANSLLTELALYEEPLLALEESPSLEAMAQAYPDEGFAPKVRPPAGSESRPSESIGHIGQTVSNSASVHSNRDTEPSARRAAILSLLGNAGPSYIKDIAGAVPGVSEKTVQRELAALVGEGVIVRKGDRRWTTYEIGEAVQTS